MGALVYPSPGIQGPWSRWRSSDAEEDSHSHGALQMKQSPHQREQFPLRSSHAHCILSYWSLFCFWTRSDFLGWTSESEWRRITWPRLSTIWQTISKAFGLLPETCGWGFQDLPCDKQQILPDSWSLAPESKMFVGPGACAHFQKSSKMNSSWGSRIIFIINNGCGIWSLKKKFKEYRFLQ